MKETIIRKSVPSDGPHIGGLASYCFGHPEWKVPAEPAASTYNAFADNIDEFYTIEEGGKFVGNGRCMMLEQNIRGIWKLTGGLGGIINAPETRRKGYAKKMILRMLADMNDAGCASSILHPALSTFYARCGYTAGPPGLQIEVNPEQFKKWRDFPAGYTVEHVAFSEGLNTFKEVYEKAIVNAHGAIKRSAKTWKELASNNANWLGIAYNPAGVPEAIVEFSIKGFIDSPTNPGVMDIKDVFWLTGDARNALFHFFYLHSHQITKLLIPLNPNEPYYYAWLDKMTHWFQIKAGSIFMVRVVNVIQCLQDIPAKHEGSIQFQVIDENFPWNNQCFEILGDGARLNIRAKGERRVPIQMAIEGLSALVYGILPVEELESFQLSMGMRKPERELLESWFPKQTPWLTNPII